jgi:hypothetical protein
MVYAAAESEEAEVGFEAALEAGEGRVVGEQGTEGAGGGVAKVDGEGDAGFDGEDAFGGESDVVAGGEVEGRVQGADDAEAVQRGVGGRKGGGAGQEGPRGLTTRETKDSRLRP